MHLGRFSPPWRGWCGGVESSRAMLSKGKRERDESGWVAARRRRDACWDRRGGGGGGGGDGGGAEIRQGERRVEKAHASCAAAALRVGQQPRPFSRTLPRFSRLPTACSRNSIVPYLSPRIRTDALRFPGNREIGRSPRKQCPSSAISDYATRGQFSDRRSCPCSFEFCPPDRLFLIISGGKFLAAGQRPTGSTVERYFFRADSCRGQITPRSNVELVFRCISRVSRWNVAR